MGLKLEEIVRGAVRSPTRRSQAPRSTRSPNDPDLRNSRQYGLWNLGPRAFYGGKLRADVHALEAWRTSVGGNDIKLAVADTGIDPAHPELGGTHARRLARASSTRSTPPTTPTARVTDRLRPRHAGRGRDGGAHQRRRALRLARASRACAAATVRATPAAASCPSRSRPGTRARPSSFDIARADPHAADVGARAMNLSFAGGGAEPPRAPGAHLRAHARLRRRWRRRATRGFDDPTLPLYPGGVRARRALHPGRRASDASTSARAFSSYGLGLDLLAPGLDVWTTFMTYPSYFGVRPTTATCRASGTSFAAPFVTGAVGLLAARAARADRHRLPARHPRERRRHRRARRRRADRRTAG